MVIVIVIPQTLKAGHKSSELGPVPWLDIPTALHHLQRVLKAGWSLICKPWWRQQRAPDSLWSQGCSRVLHISRCPPPMACSGCQSKPCKKSVILDSDFHSLTRIPLSSFPYSLCSLSCDGCTGFPQLSTPQTWECQRTKHHSWAKRVFFGT